MRFTILCLIFSLINSCAQAPDCKFAGQFTAEANAGCLVIREEKVLFVEGKNGQLSLPGGGKSRGEAPQCTAEREVWEETGIVVVAQERITTFSNGFQLFHCELLENQILDGSNRPWRFEVDAVHWLGAQEFHGKSWRFPEQIPFVREQLNGSHERHGTTLSQDYNEI